MALKRVTMQDIADACGLSRNTVSKVFNGRGAVPEMTKKTVLDKAQELGYYQRPEGDEVPETGRGSVALLTQHKLLSHNFGAFFITSFTDQICRSGYTMKIYEVSPEEIAEKKLPPHLNLEETAGILGIELFDREYLEMICALGKPTVFVDGHACASRSLFQCDYISMENIASETALVNRMIQRGARRLGFVGDKEHCNSFHERWIGYCVSLGEAGLPIDPNLCILDEDGPAYSDIEWLLGKLAAMPELPDAFVCANDYLAIHLMTALGSGRPAACNGADPQRGDRPPCRLHSVRADPIPRGTVLLDKREDNAHLGKKHTIKRLRCYCMHENRDADLTAERAFFSESQTVLRTQ